MTEKIDPVEMYKDNMHEMHNRINAYTDYIPSSSFAWIQIPLGAILIGKPYLPNSAIGITLFLIKISKENRAEVRSDRFQSCLAHLIG